MLPFSDMENPTPYTRGLSVEDFTSLDEADDELLELVRGRVVREPRPAARHGLVCATITSMLVRYAEQTGAGRVLGNDTGFVLARDPATVRGPDVAYLSLERCGQIDKWSAWIEGSPDLAVEVLSLGNRRAQIDEKVADYQRAGTRVVWLIDPESQCIVVYERGACRTLTLADHLTSERWLPGFSVRVADVFK